MMNHLLSLYIACTIFGVGVTVIDMLGFLGDLFHEGDAGAEGDGGDYSDGAHGDHDGSDAGDSGDEIDAGAGHEGHGDIGTHGDHHGDGHDVDHGDHGSIVAQEYARKRELFPQLLSVARSLVHFSLGFGPVGVFALLTGRTEPISLAWSVPVGAATLIGGRVLRRIQRSELDSQITTEDLIMEHGKVLVSIGPGQLGKVRIRLESSYADRYARAREPQTALKAGTPVRVVEVTDDCVYVEEDV